MSGLEMKRRGDEQAKETVGLDRDDPNKSLVEVEGENGILANPEK